MNKRRWHVAPMVVLCALVWATSGCAQKEPEPEKLSPQSETLRQQHREGH